MSDRTFFLFVCFFGVNKNLEWKEKRKKKHVSKLINNYFDYLRRSIFPLFPTVTHFYLLFGSFCFLLLARQFQIWELMIWFSAGSEGRHNGRELNREKSRQTGMSKSQKRNEVSGQKKKAVENWTENLFSH